MLRTNKYTDAHAQNTHIKKYRSASQLGIEQVQNDCPYTLAIGAAPTKAKQSSAKSLQIMSISYSNAKSTL